jgi:hypothetical protein
MLKSANITLIAELAKEVLGALGGYMGVRDMLAAYQLLNNCAVLD